MDLDLVAQRLHEMTASSAAPPPPETRSLENAALPISPAQLEGIFGYGPTRSGVQINEQTAITFTAVFTAVKILAESIAMLPLAVYSGDDDQDVKVRARDHSAYQLLRWQPNDEMSAVVFKETLQANLTLWGNAFARIKFSNGGDPIGLIPLESARTYVTRTAGNLRYEYQRNAGGHDSFAPEEILHVPGLTLNGVQGLSPIAYAREAIALGKAAEIFGASFFGNGAHLDGTLESPNKLSPEQIAQLRESWNAMHAGPGNSHKTAILSNGTKYTRIGIPPDEAQFIETRKFQVTEVARIYRIPPHMLGDLDRSTHSNIEHASLEFLIYTLLPWLEKWEQELTRKLCGTSGEYHVKFDDRRLLRTDIAARQAFYQIGRQWGFLNSDEIRAQEGLSPLPDGQGKTYFAPVNMVPLDQFGQTNSATIQKPAPPNTGDSPQKKRERAIAATAAVFEDALGRMSRKAANAASRGKADADFYSQHRTHIREALYPAATTLLRLLGRPIDAPTGQSLVRALDAIALDLCAADPAKRPDPIADPPALADRLLSLLEEP